METDLKYHCYVGESSFGVGMAVWAAEDQTDGAPWPVVLRLACC